MRSRHTKDVETIKEKNRIIEKKDEEISFLKTSFPNYPNDSASPTSIVDFKVECEIDQDFDDDPLK
jgi:hypothetical protein